MKIGVLASIGEGNIGDEAILASSLEQWRKEFVGVSFVVFSHDVQQTMKMHGAADITVCEMIPTGWRSLMKQVMSGEIWRVLKYIFVCDVFMIGGGGIFYDQEYLMGTNPLLVWFLRVLLLRMIGRKKIIIHAVGVGPLHKKMSKFYLREIMRMADLRSVRDEESRVVARECLLEPGYAVYVVGDPVFRWSKPSLVQNKDDINKVSERSGVGVVLRSMAFQDDGERERFVCKSAELCLRIVREYKENVYLIPFSYKKPDDHQWMQGIIAELSRLGDGGDKNADEVVINSKKIQILSFDSDYFKVLDSMMKLRLVIGMRLHSLMFSHLLKIPYLSFSYAKKVEAFLYAVKRGRFGLDWRNYKIEDLLKRVKDVMNDNLEDNDGQDFYCPKFLEQIEWQAILEKELVAKKNKNDKIVGIAFN